MFAALLISRVAIARTWTVDQGGGGDVQTIQAGIDSAITGDDVVVMPGFYDENLNMQGKSLVLRSLSGADVTVIDGGQRNRVLAMSGGVIDGFTLQRGACDQCDGGGILIFPPGPAIIRNCIIQDNSAGFAPEGGVGGGIYKNETLSGVGGIETQGEARNNTIVQNRTGGACAGIFAAVVSHNLVAFNGPGAGVMWFTNGST